MPSAGDSHHLQDRSQAPGSWGHHRLHPCILSSTTLASLPSGYQMPPCPPLTQMLRTYLSLSPPHHPSPQGPSSLLHSCQHMLPGFPLRCHIPKASLPYLSFCGRTQTGDCSMACSQSLTQSYPGRVLIHPCLPQIISHVLCARTWESSIEQTDAEPVFMEDDNKQVVREITV